MTAAQATRLKVVGNISRDHTCYPDGRRLESLGGATLHTALAAASAGAHTQPVSVVGSDLSALPERLPIPRVDWTGLSIRDGRSATFTLTYNPDDTLASSQADYAASQHLTDHALAHIQTGGGDFFHISLRRPLLPEAVLAALTDQRLGFSLDFFLPSAPAMIEAATPWLHRAAVIFTNAAEYRLLTEAVEPGTLPLVAVTDGPRLAQLYARGRPLAQARPVRSVPADVTGAGDTFAGTFLAHWLQGHPTHQALARAVHAATRHTTAPPIPIPAPRTP
ncbi:carbohydrate kinase family protein [Streptomyces yangpuensis]|uniref:carbohydrate kinase family protein n=1 Tax=Streptomyces yangpuensis TaxID=1648182 RepID=UPI0038264BA6